MMEAMRIASSTDLYALAQPAKNPVRKVADAALDAVRATTDFLDDHPLAKATVANTFAVTRGLKAFPSFIYPSIFEATSAERQQIYDVLDSLPLRDVNSVKSITMVDSIHNPNPGWVTRGRAFDHEFTANVELSRSALQNPQDFRKVLIHETGHTRDYDSAWFGLWGNHSSREPFGEGPHVSDYAQTNPKEDYAETYANYYVNPEGLREKAPEKYEFIRESSEPGFVERLIDRQEFRETGRWLGDHLASSRASRNATQAFYWATGGLQSLQGLDQLRKATETGDPMNHYQGMTNLAAGVLFSSGVLVIPGMAVHSAQRALSRAVGRGEISALDADSAVRLVTDPLERAVRGVGSKVGFTAPFKSLKEQFPDATPRRALATGIMAGGALGGAVGTLAGPYGGVIAGYHLAGPVGGAVGLVVGALGGYALGTEIGGRAGGALMRALGS